MGKMVTEKVKISPYLHREIESLVEDGDFASVSDVVNVALSSFLERKYGINEEERESGVPDVISLALLYTLVEKGVVTTGEIGEKVKKIRNEELETDVMMDVLKSLISEDDIYNLIDKAKEHENMEDYEGAEKIYRMLMDACPGDFEAYFHLGRLYRKTDREEEGKKLLEDALRIAREAEEESDVIDMITRELGD